MIEVELPQLISIPLGFNLAVLVVCWVYYGYLHRAGSARAPHGRMYRCTVCGHVYVDEQDRPLARCPRCGSNNEALRR